MGSWVSTDLGFGWNLRGGEDDEFVLPWLNELQEAQYEDDNDEDEDEEFDVATEIMKRLHDKMFPDEELKKSYYSLDNRTGFTLELVYVNDYTQSYLLLLSSKTVHSYRAVSTIPASLFETPLSHEDNEHIGRMSEALGLEEVPLGWYLGASYG